MSNDTKTDHGGPAFPTKNAMQTGPSEYRFEGMTLRDYFASDAMNGLLAQSMGTALSSPPKDAAAYAYAVADAMLAERQRAQEPKT
jgi:hypothetical protein